MEIVRAEPCEAGTLTWISFAAKRYWGYPERWIEDWKDTLTITPELVRDDELRAAVADEEATGFYALVGKTGKLELEHLWIAPDRIGESVGRAMFDHAVAKAEGFYLRMGARRTGENVHEVEGEKRRLPTLMMKVR